MSSNLINRSQKLFWRHVIKCTSLFCKFVFEKYLLILAQLTHFISLTLPKHSLTKIIFDAFMERANFLNLLENYFTEEEKLFYFFVWIYIVKKRFESNRVGNCLYCYSIYTII